jgi:superfamily II DNA/RNA helicase
MSNYNAKKDFGKKNSHQARFMKSSSQKNARGSTGSRYHRQTKRPIKTFDPSLFINNVEEHAVSSVYVPKNGFADFLIEDRIKKNIIAKGYTTPTHIQDEVIPFVLEGKDIIATANTGTGKTASFLIPLINNVLTKKIKKVLVLTPTRELADQIHSELRVFKENTGILSALCIGGSNIYNQIDHLRKNPAFVIGTPGRLLDLEKNRALFFNTYDALVLDEVDTMLDMGFLNDITHIINKLPKQRQSLFFSATIPKAFNNIIDSFLSHPVRINVKTRQTAEHIQQEVIKVDSINKVDLLHDLLIKPELKKSIIFLRTKRCADRLSKTLRDRGFSISLIHGDKTQSQRKKALSLFKDNKVNILLATDVVARGIDIDDVSHVINYDLPQTHEDYIHRIGRTGRAQNKGYAITFV